MSKIQDKHHKTFEQIRQTTDEGREFWSARDLMVVLEYKGYGHLCYHADYNKKYQ